MRIDQISAVTHRPHTHTYIYIKRLSKQISTYKFYIGGKLLQINL